MQPAARYARGVGAGEGEGGILGGHELETVRWVLTTLSIEPEEARGRSATEAMGGAGELHSAGELGWRRGSGVSRRRSEAVRTFSPGEELKGDSPRRERRRRRRVRPAVRKMGCAASRRHRGSIK